MGTKNSPQPTFRVGMFELGEREIPEHVEGIPKRRELDGKLWAIESIVVGGRGEKILIAGNIQDEEVLATLVCARFGHLSRAVGRLSEYGIKDYFNGDEVTPVIPREILQPKYAEGMSVAPESVFPEPVPAAEPAGRIATGNSGGIVPIPAFNPA